MSDVVARIAAVLRGHQYLPFRGICPCGFEFDMRDEHDAHVAAVMEYFAVTPGTTGEGDGSCTS